MSLANITTGLGEKIVDAASAVYHSTSTLFKVGTIFLAGSIAGGCSSPGFFEDYWPPANVQAELGINSKGVSGGIKGKFEGSNSTLEVALRGGERESEIEETGNTVKESELTVDADFKKGNISVNPIIETAGRTVRMPSGEQESDLKSTHVSVGVRLKREGYNSIDHLLIRPYLKQGREDTIVGPIETTRYGIHISGNIGMISPLFTYDREDILGINLQEIQAGVGFRGKLPGRDLGGLIGAYFVSTTEDDRDVTNKIVAVGDLNIVPAFNLSGDFDGDLLDIKTYGCFGGSGNSEDQLKLMRDYVRQMQQLNFLARGLPEIHNRQLDLRQGMEEELDAKLFYLVGLRQKHDTEGDLQSDFYAYVGFNIPAGRDSNSNDRKVILGPTYGPVFEPYPRDVVDKRYGILCGVYLGKIRIDGSLERVEYQNLKPENLFGVRAFIPLP